MILKKCCNKLEDLSLKIAFIESASSGYLCSQFSIHKNSGADILLGGLVSYDPIIKEHILHISHTLIQQYTAESIEVTQAMALQGKMLFPDANVIVACTGLLKPGGSATHDKPEGTFFISVSYKQVIYDFHYFLAGTALERLDALTEKVAEEVLNLISAQ